MASFVSADNECLRYAKAPLEQAIVAVESGFSPFAIGVVGGALVRQPRNKAEAIATASALQARGYNFSMGCRQINQTYLSRFGMNIESVFDPLQNASVGTLIYEDCYARAAARFGQGDSATRAALSCYYSGNFVSGQAKQGSQPSYADRVLAHLPAVDQAAPTLAIPLVSANGNQAAERLRTKPPLSAADPPAGQQPAQKQAASWDVFNDF